MIQSNGSRIEKPSRRSFASLLGAFACFSALGGKLSSAVAAAAFGSSKALEAELGCPVVTSADGVKFTIARDIWNALITKTPAFIVRCSNAQDVSRCIQYASKNSIPLSIKAGGHHPAGLALSDAGMTIDLSGMVSVEVDKARKRATIGPGVRIGHLQTVLEPMQLAAVGPIGSTVGLTGATLGGGYGWFSGEGGFASDNLISAEIVTADGKISKINEENQPDLFWAIRGGGGNFGVVTSMEIRVHDLNPLTGGVLVYAGPDVKNAARGWADYCNPSSLPREVLPQIVFSRSPQNPSVLTAAFVLKSGLQGQANDDAMARFRSFGKPVVDTIRPISLTNLQTMMDAEGEAGYRNFAVSHFLKELPDPAIDIILKALESAPSPHAIVLWSPDHGAMRERGPKDTAFYHREALFNGFITSRWSDPSEDQKNIQWIRQLWSDLRPFSTGQLYVNLTQDTDDKAAKMSYGENYPRLAQIKHRYDPKNLFRSAVNILPQA